ncbi:MAG: LAGLIDADG family homing endonuclease [Candidatus Aenigmatarchaeota archaeon]|nr:hypothetical protein [Candidatus Aenigmarchaeota archaeon]
MEIDFGYVYGILIAKGVYHSKDLITIEMSDKNLLEIAKSKLKLLGDVRIYNKIRKSNKLYNTQVIFLKIKNNIELKLGRHEWDVPSRAFISKEFRIGLLRALFDFSGTIRARLRKSGQKERSIRLSSVNENIKKIKELLKIEGINSMIYSNKKSFILEINGKHNLQLYLEKIGFENSAKKDLLEKIINPVSFEHILSS